VAPGSCCRWQART